ncbi:MAG: hypothetical protein KJ747_04995 [Actinobacteria bacterium]|nr:hypothetical protein [Actinomycetota bacterium]MCG2808523.1 hypothetical protein [Coriobacteriia bacterium]
MDLSVYLMIATIVTFMIGAGFALAWSISSGQWSHISDAARSVLESDDQEASTTCL